MVRGDLDSPSADEVGLDDVLEGGEEAVEYARGGEPAEHLEGGPRDDEGDAEDERVDGHGAELQLGGLARLVRDAELARDVDGEDLVRDVAREGEHPERLVVAGLLLDRLVVRVAVVQRVVPVPRPTLLLVPRLHDHDEERA